MKKEYAYLGEVHLNDFNNIHEVFPDIVCIGVDSDNDLVLGCDKSLPEYLIGRYQRVLGVWNDLEEY